jgi:Tfp pilus assembly protein PilN
MIRINLAQKKQASYVGGAKTGSFASMGKGAGGSAMDSLKGLMGSGSMAALTPLLIKIAIPAVLSVGAYFGYDYYVQQKTVEMAQESETIAKEKTRIETELRKIKGYEVVKAELERNELILRTKIQTIEKLIRGRDFTVKSLVVLSQALPKEVWLMDMVTTETNYSLKGGTTDIGLVSDLMSKLGQTIYFKDVQLKSTSADPTQRQATFELSARRE